MWIRDIDFPGPLLAAQRSGSLVIFAGAGVSMPSPSNYPNFAMLADDIAGGTLSHPEDEPIDHFLGRLQARGVQVHKRAGELLSAPSSKPNGLHFDLLKLFPSAAELRLVTTNFDTHFTTAAASVFQDDNRFEIFRAPALPLGHQFQGIVYLHGCVDKDRELLILTDRDFGRAYLTEGWARRFVQSLFSTNTTVLFVGYSHNDTVMNYLARGLPPDAPARRFALTDEVDPERWRFLNITPITYPLKNEHDRHGALGEALTAWVELAKMGTLDHEQRIKSIVELPPPRDRESASYIENILTDLPPVRFFTRHAKTPDWLRWTENQQVLHSLFQPEIRADRIAQEFAYWFATSFACQHPNAALALIQRGGQRLNIVLWSAIADRLSRGDPRPDSETLAKWVVMLLRTAPPAGRPSNLLESILTTCHHPTDDASAILLFEYLTRPRLDLRPSFRLQNDQEESDQVDAEVTLEGDSYWLREAWEKLFLPNLVTFTGKLESILTHHLKHAHLLLQGVGKANDLWDPLSFHRSAIEPHEQDQHERGIDILINAARDVLEWLVKSKPEHACATIDMWSGSEVPLLKRLAIHGITESPQLSPDEKLVWIQERHWFYRLGLKHEIFHLLKTAYPEASPSLRSRVLEQVCRGPEGQDAEGLDEETRQYEIYNLLLWLHRVVPECDLTTEKFEAIQQSHTHFVPRDHPDLDFEVDAGSYDPQSPVTVEELLAKDPEKEIDWLLTYRGEEIVGHGRRGLLETTAGAVVQDYAWSWKLVAALQKKSEWSSDLWKVLLRGWRKSSLTEEQWKRTLTFLLDCAQLHDVFSYPLADLLSERTRRDQEGIPAACLPLAQRVADRVWDACQEAPLDEPKAASSWLQSAINHPGGKLVEFWLNALSMQRTEAGEGWVGLPTDVKTFFDKVLTETNGTAELGRVVLASQLHFLFSLEAEWARKNILPLLDWTIDPRRAQQAWHGFLFWGRWNETLLSELVPLYEQSFTHVETELGELRGRFSEHVANIVLYSSRNPLLDGWLGKFIASIGASDREAWAGYIGHRLRSLPEGAAQHLWDRWMNEYWQQRTTGVPYRLETGELEKMVGWSVHLKPVFPDVVEQICLSPAPPLKDPFLYRELLREGLAISHSEAVTRLLQHLLPKTYEPFMHCDELEQLVRKLAESSVSRSDLQKICDELGRLGCEQASALKKLVE